jgi:lactoylglutathione lyase
MVELRKKISDKKLKIEVKMKYLHTMVRVKNIEESIDFYCNKLGLKEVRRKESEKGRFTLIFLGAENSDEKTGLLELTYNWDPEEYTGGRNFGHLAYSVNNIYETCDHLMKNGITINRPPRDGRMAFIKSPDNISIEILQEGEALPIEEPWASMENNGSW